jgi:hypothetical protein
MPGSSASKNTKCDGVRRSVRERIVVIVIRIRGLKKVWEVFIRGITGVGLRVRIRGVTGV